MGVGTTIQSQDGFHDATVTSGGALLVTLNSAGTGPQTSVTVAQTVTASSAYASGNCVGGLMTIAGIPASGFLQSVVVNSKSAQTAAIDIIFLNANPVNSTVTDKTAVAVAVADFADIAAVAHVVDWTNTGTTSVGQAVGLAAEYVLATGTTGYAIAVTRGTPTFTATTDISITFLFAS